MKRHRVGFGAIAVAVALVVSGCSGGGAVDGGDGGNGLDSGDDCVPTDAGYCGVCHVTTACGEYPPGPYGLAGGLVLPPCFSGTGNWNPQGLWLFDGSNPQFASNQLFFQDLYCSSQQNPRQTYGLIQVVLNAPTDRNGPMQASNMQRCINGPDEKWLASGGQVMQIIEQSNMSMAPTTSDLTYWAQAFNTNYSLGADIDQVLLNLMDATHGFPVTYIVNLQTMQILKAHSYGADWGQVQADFTYLLDSGIVY